MSVIIYSKGGAECVTGSCHIIDIDGKKFMIDCGLFQGKRAESDKKNREFDIDTSEIESVVLTHAHADHSCRLPLLCKNGFDGTIYTTPSTRDLANIVMMDSAKIQQKDIELLKKKRVKNKEDEFKKQPLYSEKDVLKTSKQFKTVPYKKEVNLADNVSIEFFDAGHILGSAFVSMNIFTSSNITKNYTENVLSWTIDRSFYTRVVSGNITDRMPVEGDILWTNLYFRSSLNNDIKTCTTVFKFSN